MRFPVYLPLGPWHLHPHWVFEALAYFLAFRLYLALRKRYGDPVDPETRWSVIAAAVVGAAFASKALYWLEDPALTAAHWRDPAFLLGGKSIVGALLGGLIAVELAKWRIGEKRSTGDLFAVPLCLGMAIGRVGCFLTGLADHTYGSPTSLPWGVDFGDGIPRHPVQLYELLFVLALAAVLWRRLRRPHPNGDVFKLFMVSYLGFRLAVDFLKPDVPIALGMSSIQWACVLGLAYYTRDLVRWLQPASASVKQAEIGWSADG
jgi:phosphatidylglycerol---prolipoprotein diacylglyceryl transferase